MRGLKTGHASTDEPQGKFPFNPLQMASPKPPRDAPKVLDLNIYKAVSQVEVCTE